MKAPATLAVLAALALSTANTGWPAPVDAAPAGRTKTARPADPGVAALIAAQKNIAWLTADFTLTIGGAGENGSDFIARGKVWLASGRRYRVEYTSPESQVLVSDGRQRWLYLKKINQVQLQALPANGNPQEFFLEIGGGLPDLIRRCRVRVERPKNQQTPGRVFELTPLEGQDLQFAQAKIRVQGKKLLPQRVDIQAARPVTVEFQAVTAYSRADLKKKPGTAVPEEKFTFTPPPGAEVIENLWQ